MKRISLVVIFGLASAVTWAWLVASWGYFVSIHLFQVLFRITGINGPLLMVVDDLLFSLSTALLFTLIAVVLFKKTWPLPAIIFIFSFVAGLLIAGGFSAISVSFMLTYHPLWLFSAFFLLFNSISSRVANSAKP